MTRNPDIVFIAGTLGLGGAERQLYYVLQALRRNGMTPVVLSITSGEAWEDKIRELGVQVRWIGRCKFPLVRLLSILLLLLRHRPEIIQSVHFHTNLYTMLAARLLHVFEIGAIRNDAYGEVRRLKRWGGLLLHSPRVLFANSAHGIKNAIDLGVPPARLRLLPNAVDSSIFKPSRKKHDGSVHVVTIGRLAPQKRMDRFLAVFKRVTLQRSLQVDVKGTIVGSGPLREELLAYARELRLFPRFVQLRESTDDILSVYRDADILVLTSDYEGTPNVVLEAMACGLPVVAFGIAAIREIICHAETGIIVEPGDISAMANVIVSLANDKEWRESIGRQARRYILKSRSLDVLEKNLSSYYGGIIAPPAILPSPPQVVMEKNVSVCHSLFGSQRG
ncbi:glycosyltransferase [candidate division KSB1 bacterium]|nr:glycosyltransferase [candidate division KSB1 bacterium]